MKDSEIIKKTECYEHIIWDWNGTLVNDVTVALNSVCTLLEENNLPKITIEQYKNAFGFPIRAYYENIGFDLSKTSFEFLCTRFHEEYEKNKALAGSLFSDVEDHLSYFSTRKKQSILSAGAQWHLDNWVKSYGIEKYFDHIFGIDNDQASSKVYRGHELIKASKANKEKTIMIGDTDHDLEVGNELGIDVLLIANGHQSFERLTKVHHNVIESRLKVI